MMLENTQNNSQKLAPNNRPTHRISNAIFLKISGKRLRIYSLLTHIGRKSGKEYRVPVSAFPFGDGFVLALLYGKATEVDWCRNVMAAGKCVLRTRGQDYVLDKPEIIPASQALKAYPPLFRFMYRAQGITEFLWVHHMQS